MNIQPYSRRSIRALWRANRVPGESLKQFARGVIYTGGPAYARTWADNKKMRYVK